MAVASITSGVKILDWGVGAPAPTGAYVVNARIVWYDNGIPTVSWLTYTNDGTRTAEEAVNEIIALANAAYIAAHP